MNDKSEWFIWITLGGNVLVIFLMLYIRYLLPNYFKKKGENIATKEDIGEITKLVEEVKIAFTKDVEILKAGLQLNTNMQLSMYRERHDAVVSLNSTLQIWIDFLTNSSLIENDNDNTTLVRHKHKIAVSYQEVTRAHALSSLIVDDDNLDKTYGDVLMKILEVHAMHIQRLISSLVAYNNTETGLVELPDSTNKSEAIDRLNARRVQAHQVFRDSVVASFAQVHPLFRVFQKTAKEYLLSQIQKIQEK